MHSGLGSPRPRARAQLALSRGAGLGPVALPAASPTAPAPLSRVPPWVEVCPEPRGSLLPGPRWLPSERVLGQEAAEFPAGRDPPAQLWRDEGKGDSPGPPFSPQSSLLRSAGKPSRPSLPKAAPRFPELGPVRKGSPRTLARRAQEAATPRRLQRPGSRHLVWRRSRGRRHAERLGRREGGDGGGGCGRGQRSRGSSAPRRLRGRRHSGPQPR